VSFAAGILVTKAGISGATEKIVFGQLSAYPPALMIVSFIMILIAFLPGMPMIPFLLLAGGSGYLAYYTNEQGKIRKTTDLLEAAAAETPVTPADEPIAQVLAIDQIRLELGYALLGMVNAEDGNRLTGQIKGLRRQMATDLGFILPSVRIQDNLQLGPQ